jgi:hypothetical protein
MPAAARAPWIKVMAQLARCGVSDSTMAGVISGFRKLVSDQHTDVEQDWWIATLGIRASITEIVPNQQSKITTMPVAADPVRPPSLSRDGEYERR